MPVVDSRMDEEYIWNFQLNGFNQRVINNQYVTQGPLDMESENHQYPQWGRKLIGPAFYSNEKVARIERQHQLRLGLESIKKR